MKHAVLSFITPIDPAQRPTLEGKILPAIQADLESNAILPFARLSSLHFASLCVLDQPGFGPCLVFEHNFDGSLDSYLDELYAAAGPGLHQIYACCAGYPGPNRAALLEYLRTAVQRPHAYYIGTVGRTAEQIRKEAGLRASLETRLDSIAQSGSPVDPSALHREIQRTVQSNPALGWVAADLKPRETAAARLFNRIALFAPVIALVLVVLGLVVTGSWSGLWIFVVVLVGSLALVALLLYLHEIRDPVIKRLPAAAHIAALSANEDQIVQNHMIMVTQVKPGLFRKALLRIVLFLVNRAARISTQGNLGGIPTIHFAHWSMIDGGRRLLFLSNYGGSWQNYLDDFIDKAARGLTGVWSNTVEFPRTQFLVFRGAQDGQGFKAWVRTNMSVTSVWYSAYRSFTVQNVNSASDIREGIVKQLSVDQARDWLRLF